MAEKPIGVDAFSGTAFGGNPAVVCLLQAPRAAAWMQAVAREMQASETAFLQPRAGEDASFALRWFTPTVEVSLCGHATLASAHAVWQEELAAAGAGLRFRASTCRASACTSAAVR
ncbi:MAG: PhzF family phenazine biosynthesis protein [Terriglobales bacterium]